MGQRYLKEEMNFMEAKKAVPNVQYNWVLLKLCYETWKDDIKKAHDNGSKLYEILHVSQNYVSKVCRNEVEKPRVKDSNYDEFGMISYLRGDGRLVEYDEVYTYILWVYFERIYCDNDKIAHQGLSEVRKKWCIKNYDYFMNRYGKLKNDDVIEKRLKKKCIDKINNEGIKKKVLDRFEDTELGKIKKFLCKFKSDDYTYLEIKKGEITLASLVNKIDMNMIYKMDESTLKNFLYYGELLMKKLNVQRELIEIQKLEGKT